ncbi:class F sortase [Sutcliffiella horikoshii]|uniref:class F sortase n=1 Tax=Sutcliffiella horikoshii TaxID=79883 RepID=UPI001CFE96AC|nr:class F sortase [Sutcliffiella horikoshii]
MRHKNNKKLLGLLGGLLIFSTACSPITMNEADTNLPPETVNAPEEEIASQVDENNTKSDEENQADSNKSEMTPPPKGIIPTRLTIPAINVDASVKPYGLDESGAMAVPEDGETVAWFEPGTKPGAKGNAVLAAHVDDYTGPAIFFYLKDLEIGDEVIVEDGDQTLTFVVTGKEAYPYDQAPIRTIFGPTNNQQLNLITCTGLYDRKTNNHQERLVIYTELKET